MTLASRLTTDLDAKFFDPNDFAVTASYGALATEINGIFENQFGEFGGMAATRPTFICRTSDVSDAVDGTALTIAGVAYTIRVVENDGTGVTVLILELD